MVWSTSSSCADKNWECVLYTSRYTILKQRSECERETDHEREREDKEGKEEKEEKGREERS